MNAPANLKDYFNPYRIAGASPVDYGEYLEDLNRYSGFMDRWGHMLFILDGATQGYPFLNKGTSGTMGVPKEALKEGGLDFTISRLEIPEEIQGKRARFAVFCSSTGLPKEMLPDFLWEFTAP